MQICSLLLLVLPCVASVASSSVPDSVTFFNIYSEAGDSSNETIADLLWGQHSSQAAAQSDFVLITGREIASGADPNDPSDSIVSPATSLFSSASRDAVATFIENYASVNSHRIFYRQAKWTLLQQESSEDATSNSSSIWARFAELDDSTATVCVVLSDWDPSWNQNSQASESGHLAVRLVTDLLSHCSSDDVVAFGLTAAVSSAVTEYLQGTASVDNALSPLPMVESVNLLAQQQITHPILAIDLNSIPVAASGRLFVHLASSMCVDQAWTALGSDEAGALGALVLQFCHGSACNSCTPSLSSSSNDSSSSSKNSSAVDSTNSGLSATEQNVAIVVCCLVFLLGSACLYHLVFGRKRALTLSSSDTSKAEKEIATNLAYVLRV